MRIWTAIKISAALVVIAVIVFTSMLVRHVTARPAGGIFSVLIPEPGRLRDQQQQQNFASTFDTREIPDIDPGEQAFDKAYELLVIGRKSEARGKFTTITESYPNSSSATNARRILGEMNLDEILSPDVMDGKKIYTVQSGDSYLAIASRYDTSIDCMIHLNSMFELKGIQPGDELIVMPLDFSLLIEPHRRTVSVWQGERFICEYPALSMLGVPSKKTHTSINSKIAEVDNRRVTSHSDQYRAAHKVIQLASPSLQVRAWNGDPDQAPASGILLRPRDMEELALLTRVGNTVEIR